MPPITSVENNFTRGLITEATGLNFPENAATDTDNCEYTLVGDVVRREGIDFETNYVLSDLGSRSGNAVSSYKWNNAGGDGNTQLIVVQNGGTLYFYTSSAATTASPVSTRKLNSTVTLNTFLPTGSTKSSLINSSECQYADGNGYLFVYHPYLDPFYCTYSGGSISASVINIMTRDFKGVPETNTPVDFRPTTLTNPHNYNIHNQGWHTSIPWTATSTSSPTLTTDFNGNWTVANTTFTIASGLTISAGSFVTIYGGLVFTHLSAGCTIQGQVSSYSGTSLAVNIISCTISPAVLASANNLISANWNLFASASNDQISTWFSALSNYPSNADVWWVYKDSTGVFNPSSTVNNFPAPTAQAGQGHYILSEFNQQRTLASGIANITDITTYNRPRTGTWFQGRVWFTGVDDSFQPAGTAPYTTWTENIYFSQVVDGPLHFGKCYQEEDPTDQNFNSLLPTDGGVIVIPGSGSIYKLFPVINGMLVFAGNGVWFITGSQGIGFSANDYTITKISSIQSISSTSFVDVMGLPYFWNEEGIYAVEANKQGNGNLEVNPITVGTILTFYNNIPKQSKKFVRGAYHPTDYVIQWVYKSTNETSVTDRYAYNRILNYNVYNKAFFPYTVDISNASINSILFVQGPGGSNTPPSAFKYVVSFIQTSNYRFTFGDEHDTSLKDWHSTGTDVDYTSYFITGYKIHGDGLKKTSIPYVTVFSRSDGSLDGYYIQGLWDYATSSDANRWSTKQFVEIWDLNRSMIPKRHRIRGRGLTLQLKFSSISGRSFDIMGWAIYETVNQGV